MISVRCSVRQLNANANLRKSKRISGTTFDALVYAAFARFKQGGQDCTTIGPSSVSKYSKRKCKSFFW
jgi:hypothetical protein